MTPELIAFLSLGVLAALAIVDISDMIVKDMEYKVRLDRAERTIQRLNSHTENLKEKHDEAA